MTPAGIMAALAEHGARIAVDGDRVRLLPGVGRPLPADLVQAAREHKAALRVLATAPEADDVPADIVAGLDQLAIGAPLLDEWPRRIAAARELAARWHTQARRLGWGDASLYGLHPAASAARRSARGLAWSLDDGDRVTALTADCAVIENAHGNQLRYYHARHGTGAVVAWRLPIDSQAGDQ